MKNMFKTFALVSLVLFAGTILMVSCSHAVGGTPSSYHDTFEEGTPGAAISTPTGPSSPSGPSGPSNPTGTMTLAQFKNSTEGRAAFDEVKDLLDDWVDEGMPSYLVPSNDVIWNILFAAYQANPDGNWADNLEDLLEGWLD
jgi:hypothetical protein